MSEEIKSSESYQKSEIYTDQLSNALDYTADVAEAVSIDVSDILHRVVTHAEKNSIFEKNIEILQNRFPKIATEILSTNSSQEIIISESQNGPVATVTGQSLDHPQKPVQAAEGWVKRSLIEKRFADCKEILVYGFGFGYHVEALLSSCDKTISVIEPNITLLRKACEVRDLSNLLTRIKAIYTNTDLPREAFTPHTELLIRPQSIALYENGVNDARKKCYGMRGLTALHPTTLVLGPLQGGTLPITGYTTRALTSLAQRVREIDLSPFAQGYHAIEKIVKDPIRQSVMHANYIEMISQAVIESVQEKKIDILVCMAQAPISTRALTELRAQGIITVLWFMEDYLRFGYWKEMAKYYDFVFTIQKGECLQLIKEAGAGEVHYLPVGCDPIVHTPLKLTPEEKSHWGSPISFVGAGYHNRQQLFAAFAEMPFKIWGTEWPGCKPFDRLVQEGGRRLTPEEYIKIFNATDININLHSSTERDGVDPHGDFINPRTFELAAAGAFQLVDEREYLKDYFEIGKEIVTFKDPKDLRDKIEYYYNHPEERRQIAERGRARALSQHTYGHRLQDMLSIIYSSRYEQLKNKLESHPWQTVLKRAEPYPELYERCKKSFERGEEPNLDGLLIDIMVGNGKLTETEQKLLFFYHVRKQIIHMKREGAGG